MTYNAANNKARRTNIEPFDDTPAETNIEQWKTIDGFPDYKVSTLGRVLSLKGDVPKILKPAPNGHGYLGVRLCDDDGIHPKTVHRLVATAFIDNPDNKPEINHISGIKTDNRVENLEWCSRLENVHAFNPSLKLTEQKVKDILEILSWNEFTQQEIADAYGVSRRNISDIKNGKCWSHVTGIGCVPQKIRYIERVERIYFANDESVSEAV